MTLPPQRLGDKGQRYEVRCCGYPNEGKNVIGWAGKLDGAIEMAEAIALAPGATAPRVLDREDGYKVVWRPKPEGARCE